MLGSLYFALAVALVASPVHARSLWPAKSTHWSRISPAEGAVVVDNSAKPYPGSYTTFQAGVDALNKTTRTPQNLFVFPGTYVEQVYIPLLASNLTVQGYTHDARSYEENEATVTYNLALINTTSDDLTATLRQWNTNTKVYNLNVVNTFGHIHSNGQNLAVSAHTTGQAYYGCQLIGYQDTLLANTGTQLYTKSLIVGAVDFIFGQTALTWLEGVDIRMIAAGCITASGRSSDTNPSWYVVSRSTVSGINDSVAAGGSYLGRPWGSFARVVFQETYLGSIVAAAGWKQWSTSTPNTDNVTFAEYNNRGPGSMQAESPRASFSEQLTAPISIRTILGANFQDEWWVDTSYLDPSDLAPAASTTSTSTVSTTSTASSMSTTTAPSSPTASANPCFCTEYAQIATAVASCTDIVLSNIAAPNGAAIRLSGLKTGATVTFDGRTTFGFANSSSFTPITIRGTGVTITASPGAVIDGNGPAYWDGLGSNGGVPKPDHFIVLKLTGHSVVQNLHIQNWPVHLFSISGSKDLVMQDLVLDNSAGDAPNNRSGGRAAAHNSDGFDLSSSVNVLLQRIVVDNQDDCVAVTSGNNVTVRDLVCRGGHGLSIGSVGLKSNNNVTNIVFSNSSVANSENACRIKTNYNATGFVANITFSSIVVSNISRYGIDVQQDYLNGGPTGNPSNGVLIENVLFQNVTGHSRASAQDYYVLCGDGACSNIAFSNVSIGGGAVASSCNYPATGCPS
ncbi:hypothetical protein HMPREF1624_02547 [Sporothrix schenckii ATCC 58251]|uniref:Pectinase n=1 Tax=Sporothrix schenckii (strain ATCC 58251 / de Perez 2211183) TaxID=1391915 RepID=U7Q069_SPOS1|nr:hypothetical protein HMPREF1624_02547 [Sporothrix schenckii ATCC 58251]